MKIRALKMMFAVGWVFILFSGCAGSPKNDLVEEEPPCKDCGTRGELELEISNEKFYREWNPLAFAKWDSSALLGVLPVLSVVAEAPENCRFCHSFSADALDFDLAQVEESLFQKYFPTLRRELFIAGAFVAEQDSLRLQDWILRFEKAPLGDSLALNNLTPWVSREGIEQLYSRPLSEPLKKLLFEIGNHYRIRYLSVPVFLKVRMDPKLGKSGGYEWTILWTLWDIRYQELVFLCYSEFTVKTKNRVPPERFWAKPFAERFERMFTVDFSEIENH